MFRQNIVHLLLFNFISFHSSVYSVVWAAIIAKQLTDPNQPTSQLNSSRIRSVELSMCTIQFQLRTFLVHSCLIVPFLYLSRLLFANKYLHIRSNEATTTNNSCSKMAESQFMRIESKQTTAQNTKLNKWFEFCFFFYIFLAFLAFLKRFRAKKIETHKHMDRRMKITQNISQCVH